MKRIALALLFCFAIFAAAQQQPVMNSITSGADGKYEAAPDTAVIQFNIAAQENTSQAAYDRASKAAEQVRQLMRNDGIDPTSAQIGSYSIAPVFDYKSPKRKLVGYTVNTSVTLKLKDFSKIGPIVQQLTDLDLTDSQSISYTLDNMEAAKAKAVADAYHKARATAEVIATTSSRPLGDLLQASVDSFEPGPRPMMKTVSVNGAAGPPPTEQFTP